MKIPFQVLLSFPRKDCNVLSSEHVPLQRLATPIRLHVTGFGKMSRMLLKVNVILYRQCYMNTYSFYERPKTIMYNTTSAKEFFLPLRQFSPLRGVFYLPKPLLLLEIKYGTPLGANKVKNTHCCLRLPKFRGQKQWPRWVYFMK